MPELLTEAAAVAEEVAAAGEIAGSVDLTTISQQLGQILTWQMAQFCGICVLVGVILGVAFAKVVGKTWK